MQNRALYQFLGTTVGLMLAGTVFAQNFNLFEPVEVSGTAAANQPRPGREVRAVAATPEFMLLGSSRIGDKVSIILGHRDGGRAVVRTEIGASVPVPEYTNYRIVASQTGKVSLIMPAGSPCIDFPESGVRCNDNGEIAELTLPNRPAVASNKRQSAFIESAQTADSRAIEVVDDPGNPFEIMRARALNGNDANPANPADDTGQDGRFVPRRIDPSEVPPGMRVVSTPFGDRLVNQ